MHVIDNPPSTKKIKIGKNDNFTTKPKTAKIDKNKIINNE